jgi:hypothetical protein
MGILELTIGILVVCVFIFLGTQVVWPIITGEPLFPVFRKSAVAQVIVQAEHKLQEVAEVEHLNKVMSEIQRRKAEMEKKE